jgi:hypothetical protein
MNKLPILCALAAVAAFGQSQTPLTITQSAGSATGELRMQERRTNGQNYVGIAAPDSVTANITWRLPGADGGSGQCLQTDGAGIMSWGACGGALSVTSYDWSQAPGGSISVGANTIMLTPCPASVDGTLSNFPVRLSGGTGTAETVLLTGGTGTGGDASCTVDFTAANTHTGSWTASSASGGLHEALIAAGTGGAVHIPAGTVTIDDPAPGQLSNVYIDGPSTITGEGYASSILSMSGDQFAIYVNTTSAVIVRDAAIQGSGAQTSGGGIRVGSTGLNHNCASIIDNVSFSLLYDGVRFEKQCTPKLENNRFYAILHEAIHLENTWCADCGDAYIIGNFIQDPSAVTTGIYWVNGGGARIIANKFLGVAVGIDAQFGPDTTAGTDGTSIALIQGNSFDQNTVAGVRMNGTIGFVGAKINGNVFTQNASPSGFIAVDYGNTGTMTYLNGAIENNQFHCGSSSGYTAIRVRGSTETTIDGNIVSYCEFGVQVDAAATAVAIGKNTFYGTATPYVLNGEISPTSPIMATGYLRDASSGSNIKTIAEFLAPASGEVNNAILFGTNTTGTNSQRGMWWDTAANFYLSRFSSNRSTGQADDLKLEADGDARFYYNVGIGRSPTSGVALDAQGVVRSTDGTTITQMYSNGGAAYIGTQSNHPVRLMQDNTERLRVTNTQLLPGLVDGYLYLGDRTLQFNTVFATGFESIQSSAGFMSTRKLQIHGDATGSLFDYFQKPTSTSIDLRNTAGNLVMRWDSTGITYNGVSTMYQLWPGGTTETLDLGVDLARWKKLWVKDIDGTGTWQTTGTFTATGLTINTGAATTGYVWTATSSGGAGSWQAIPTSLPVVDTTGIAKGSSDASKIVRFEVDGFTTGTTRVLTPPNADATIAGLNVTQTFVNPQTVAIASVQNQMTLAQTNSTATYDPACLVLASTDTVTSTVYGAARLCAGYQTASFTNEKFAIQTATGSGTYQDAITITNQAVALPGALTVTGLTTFNGFVDMLGAGINYMYGTLAPQVNNSGSIGMVGSRYGDGFFSALDVTASGFTLSATTTVGYCWTATSTGGAGSWQACGGSKWTAGSGSDVYRAAGNVGIGTSAPQGLIDLFSASNIGTSPLISMRSDFAAAGRFGGIRFGDQSQTSLYQKGAIYYESVATSARGKIHIALEATDTSASVGLSDARLTVTQSGIEVPGAANIGGTLTATGLTVNTGAAAVGYVWTATSTGGAGSWQANPAALPVVDTTGIAKGSSDATKIARLEVDGLTTGTTRVLTVQDGDHTLAGLNINQTFVNPQTVAIASVQNQLTLSQTNNTGFYDPACLVLASTDTVGSTVYGAGRLCGGYESASFTNEKVAIQTATGSGTYQDAVTFKNQVATFAGDITATVGSFSFSSGTMTGTMKPLFNATGKIGDTSYYYGNGYFTTADIGTINGATAYKMGGTTVVDSSRNASFANLTWSGTVSNSITFSAGSTYNIGSTGAPPLNIWGNYITPVTELTMGSGVVFRGSLIPATNNTDAIGNTSFRVSNVATVNVNISGTITTPSGSAGITSTKTVRDSAGTGTCTLTFSGGILTGGTC